MGIGQNITRFTSDSMMTRSVRCLSIFELLSEQLQEWLGTFYDENGFNAAAMAAATGYDEDEATLAMQKIISMTGIRNCITGVEQKTNNDNVLADLQRIVAPLIDLNGP